MAKSKKPVTPAGTPTAPGPAPTESKAVKFRRIATRRVNSTVHAIRLLGNLSNRSTYEYTPEQADTLLTALSEAVDHVVSSFTKQVAKDKDLVQF